MQINWRAVERESGKCKLYYEARTILNKMFHQSDVRILKLGEHEASCIRGAATALEHASWHVTAGQLFDLLNIINLYMDIELRMPEDK